MCFCDGIFVQMAVLVVRDKSPKIAKLGNVQPLLAVCGGVLVIVRDGCYYFRGLKTEISDLE